MMSSESIAADVRAVILPIGDFGETLVISIIGYTERGEPFARAVMSRVMRCFPDGLGHATQLFGEIATSDFLHKFELSTVHEWTPPLKGLLLGEWQKVEGYDTQSIVQVTMQMCAMHVADQPEAPDARNEPVSPRTTNESRFLNAVQAEVSKRMPRLEALFRRKFSLTGKASGEVDFVGSNYATCFAAIDPKGRGGIRVKTAAAALWRLARARDAFGWAAPKNMELTAWIPAPGQPIYSNRDYEHVDETIAELSEQAKREDLGLFSAFDYFAASKRLLQVESETSQSSSSVLT